jgi:hypothetical protein
MKIGTKSGIYGVDFAKPIPVPASGYFHIVFDKASQIVLPVTGMGQSGIHFEHDRAKWSGLKATTNWTYRVRCSYRDRVPTLLSSTRPVIGKTLQIDLASARANSAALFFLGASKTDWGSLKLPFTLPFTQGCQVLCSGEVTLAIPTSSARTGTLGLAIPNVPNLVGVSFHNQFFVIDPGVNRLQVVSSNAGSAKIGLY